MAKKPTPGEQAAQDAARQAAAAQLANQQNTGQGIYIGVQAGSDLENLGKNQPAWSKLPASGWPGQAKRRGVPKYKVGYQNSTDFSRELNNMDPNVVYFYQQRLNTSGMLDSFTPGKLDKATRGAFKELLSTANQTGASWQSTLQDVEASGGVVSADKARQPFTAQLDDPATLREAFQQTAQSLYGGDLPDAEINAMVDSYRAVQQQKQQTAYDTAETGGTITSEASPGDYAAQQIRAQHPDQVAKVAFSGTFSKALSSLSQTGGGL